MEVRFIIFFLTLVPFLRSKPLKLFNMELLPFRVPKPNFSLENNLLNKDLRPATETTTYSRTTQRIFTTARNSEDFLFPDDPLLVGGDIEVQTPADGARSPYLRPRCETTSPKTLTEPALSIAKGEMTTQKIIIAEPEMYQVVNSDFGTTAISTAYENVTPYTQHEKPGESLASREGSSSATFLPEQDEDTTKSSKPAPVPVDGGRRIIDVPVKGCPDGTKRSPRGDCRTVYS